MHCVRAGRTHQQPVGGVVQSKPCLSLDPLWRCEGAVKSEGIHRAMNKEGIPTVCVCVSPARKLVIWLPCLEVPTCKSGGEWEAKINDVTDYKFFLIMSK